MIKFCTTSKYLEPNVNLDQTQILGQNRNSAVTSSWLKISLHTPHAPRAPHTLLALTPFVPIVTVVTPTPHVQLVTDGNLLVLFGGSNSIEVFNNVWTFDPDNLIWKRRHTTGHRPPYVYGRPRPPSPDPGRQRRQPF